MLRLESPVEKAPSLPTFRPSQAAIPRNGKTAASSDVTSLTHSPFPPLLTQENQDHCLLLNACGDKEARRSLIISNLRLVTLATRRFKRWDDYEDMVSAGVVALIRAVDGFRPEEGTAFSTFALTCIKNEVVNYVKKKSRRVGEISLETVLAERGKTNGHGGRLTMGEVLGSTDGDGGRPVGSLTQTVFLSRMRESLAFLSARERLVLNLRYGLKDKKEKTQQEVAEAMGIDRSRVSRIEKRAIERMRETMDLPPEPAPSL